MQFLITALIDAVALWLATLLIPGLNMAVDGNNDAVNTAFAFLVLGIVFAAVNSIVKPVISILSIPLYILTLGLFIFVVNAAMLGIASWISGILFFHFSIHSFWDAIFGAIIVSIVTSILNAIFTTRQVER